MNADGNNLPVEERRKLRRRDEARRATEIREGLLRSQIESAQQRQAIDNHAVATALEALVNLRGKLPPVEP